MVIWSLQVAIRGTVSLTAYKTQLKNARHRLNEAPRRRAYFHERRSLNNFHRDRVITFEQIAE
ncbi:TPA: hypothetical protein HMV05_24795 [Escherichia coli]|nr:hypothetical protein [Escherichia coli]